MLPFSDQYSIDDSTQAKEWDIRHDPEHARELQGTINEDVQLWLKIVNLVIELGCDNKDMCHIRVNHHWNFELLRQLLVDYHDKEIVELLQFGWPIERNDDIPLELGGINHKGATKFPAEIDRYIEKEINMGAMIGPFESIPFSRSVPVAILPLSSREK